jgi:hypothetical protein
LEIAVDAADSLIELAFRREPEGDERVLAEAKALIREYLHRHVDNRPERRRPAAKTSGGKK